MSKRFVVNKDNIEIDNEKITVIGEEVHHINVLRYQVEDIVYINEYEVKIENLNKESLHGQIIGSLIQKGIPNKNITLIQSYLKSDKMDYVVQKAVELGVKTIVPVLTKNTVVKLDEKDKIKKLDRLSKIAKGAIEQCGRTDIVKVESVKKIFEIDFSKYDAVLICHETSTQPLKDVIKSVKAKQNIAVLVGPEGGLDNDEVEKILKNDNTFSISLGERILRAETASLAVLSILDYEFN